MFKLFFRISFFIFLLVPSLSHAANIEKTADAQAIYLKALLYESQGNLNLAMEHLEAALLLSPDSALLHRELASVSIRLGLMTRAANAIERAIELDPKNVKSYILAGQIHWAIGDTKLAESRFRSAVELEPNEAEPLMNLAMSVTARDPEAAIALYKDYLKKHPGEVEILERVAQIYQGLGKLDKANTEWSKVLEWSPNSLRANLALAQIAEVHADTMTAISHYKAVLTHDPNNLPLLLRVGELQYRNNEMNEAYEVFSKARSIAPESASANFWLALLSEQRGEWEQAIELLENVAENAKEPGVMLRLSYYYSQAGQKKKGIQVLKELSDSDPSNRDFLSYLAVAYEEDGQNKNAEKVLIRLVELDPTNAEAHFNLGTLYDRSKRFNEAEKYFKKAIELKPDYHVAMNYLGYSYADRNVNLQKAEDLISAAIVIEPENGAYLDSMGWVYFRMGKLGKAEDFLHAATAHAHDPLIWDHLAQVQFEKGIYIDAILSWEESLRLDPSQNEILKKIPNAQKKLKESEKIELFIKKALTYFSDLNSLSGVIEVKVCETKPCFESRAQFQYIRGQELRVEIPGPLTGPVLLLVKPHGKATEYGAIHPMLQSAESYVKRAFEKIGLILTADVFRYINLEELKKNAKLVGSAVTAKASGIQIRFNNKTGQLDEIKWIVSDEQEIIVVKSFRKTGFTTFPTKWFWEDSKRGITIAIKFVSPVVTFSPNIDD